MAKLKAEIGAIQQGMAEAYMNQRANTQKEVNNLYKEYGFTFEILDLTRERKAHTN